MQLNGPKFTLVIFKSVLTDNTLEVEGHKPFCGETWCKQPL